MSSTSDAWAQALKDYARPGGTPGSVTSLAAFDPSEALATYGKAAAGDFNQVLGQNLSDLRGRAAGASRLKTGFYDEDVGRLTKTIAGQYQRDLASQAMNAAGLKASTLGQAAGLQEEEQNRYLDLLSGQLDRETARQNQIKAEQGSVWNTVGSIAGLGAGILLSSERFKDDIEPLEGASDKLSRVPGVRFKYRGSGQPQVGVLAEDVDREMPEASIPDESGQPMAVDLPKMLPMVIQATREQGEEIQQIKGVLAQLVSGGKLGERMAA